MNFFWQNFKTLRNIRLFTVYLDKLFRIVGKLQNRRVHLRLKHFQAAILNDHKLNYTKRGVNEKKQERWDRYYL